MKLPESAGKNSFVLLRIGDHRFGLPADAIAELAPPVRLHTFPHRSRSLTGVIVRRGKIVPVYETNHVLGGKGSSAQSFYLIARRGMDPAGETGAIPVNGECELVTCEMQPAGSDRPAWVAGTLTIGEELLDVLDLESLVALNSSPQNESVHVEPRS
jgi:chemotaxis signal transduction protein